MHEFGRTRRHLGHGPGRRRRAPCARRLRPAVVRHAVRRSAARWTPAPPTRWSVAVGLTGLPFTNVVNGCATGGIGARSRRYNTIESGACDLGIAIGFDKHEQRRVPRSKGHGGKDWYGGSGLALTTQFFGMKINRYMHEHGITAADARQGRRQGVPQRCAQPDGLATQAAERGGDRSTRRCCRTRSPSTCSARPARAAWR